MDKRTIAIIGGDRRESVLAEQLLDQGYALSLWGLAAPGTPAKNTPLEAARGAEAIILPMAGLQEDLTVPCQAGFTPAKLAEEFFTSLPGGLPIIIGRAGPELRKLAAGALLIEAGEDDELAVLNSVPTAEGAIAIAMAQAPVTLHGSSALVLGWGRCGASLARMLGGIGAQVTVAARKAAHRARAQEMGFGTCHLAELPERIGEQSFVFNTVPALLLGGEVLALAPRDLVIVDIASGGGTDFAEAARLGLTAVLAPGLPGKVAPVTAGKILARVYPRLLEEQAGWRGRET